MHIGQHSVEVEGDTVICCMRGDVTLEELNSFLVVIEKTEAEYGYYLTLLDIQQMGSVRPETRRRGAEWARHHNIAGTACYGGSMIGRTIIRMTLHAINLLHGRPSPVAFLATEVQAREWLAARRQQLGARS